MKEIEELGYNLEELQNKKINNAIFSSFCFELVKKYGENSPVIEKVSKVIGKNPGQIIYYARNYRNESNQEYKIKLRAHSRYQNYQNNGVGLKYKKYIDELINIDEDNKEAIAKYFYTYPFMYKKASEMPNFIVNLYDADYKKVYVSFKKRLIIFRDYLMEERKKKRENEQEERYDEYQKEAFDIYYKIMKSNDLERLEEIYKKYSISLRKYKFYNQIWKDNKIDDVTLFDLVEEKLHNNRVNNSKKYLDKIWKVLPLMESGIAIKDKTRKFDIFDCYTYFGDDLEKILPTIKLHYTHNNYQNADEKKELERISLLKRILVSASFKDNNNMSRNYYHTSNELEQELTEKILKTNYEIDKKAADGALVPGSGHFVTKEECLIVIKAIKDYNIPFTTNMFLIGLERLNNGKLELITPDTIDNYLDKEEVRKK